MLSFLAKLAECVPEFFFRKKFSLKCPEKAYLFCKQKKYLLPYLFSVSGEELGDEENLSGFEEVEVEGFFSWGKMFVDANATDNKVSV